MVLTRSKFCLPTKKNQEHSRQLVVYAQGGCDAGPQRRKQVSREMSVLLDSESYGVSRSGFW